MKLTDDVASLNPNIGGLNYDVDLDDAENCLHSEGIQTMPEENASPSTPTASSTLPRPMARESLKAAGISGLAMSKAETTS